MKRLFFGLLICSLAACSRTSETTTSTETTTTTETTATAAASDTTGTLVPTDTAVTDTTTATGTTGTNTATTATAATATAKQEKKPMSSNPYENKVAELHTSSGEIDIRFFPDVAPNHVKNFIDLAQQGFYNGIKFHRVMPGFMIQGGDPNTKSGNPNTWGMGGSPNKLKAEFNNISHKRGIVSAARTQDPNSASSQFFIVVADSTFLDKQYTVFGQVTKGMDVADKIVNAQRDANDRPNNPTTITSVTIRDARPDEMGPAPK